MARTRVMVALAGLMLIATGCDILRYPTSQVYQGECISLAEDGKAVTLKNTEPSLNKIEGPEATFDLSHATVGAAPAPGNKIRVAYLTEGGKYRVLKLMNLTKQDLSKQ